MKSKRKAGAAGRRERRAFSAEFKAEAVRLVAERRALESTLAASWPGARCTPGPTAGVDAAARQESRAGAGVPGETLEQENRRLRREVAVLRQEQAFAKKVAVYFAKESR